MTAAIPPSEEPDPIAPDTATNSRPADPESTSSAPRKPASKPRATAAKPRTPRASGSAARASSTPRTTPRVAAKAQSAGAASDAEDAAPAPEAAAPDAAASDTAASKAAAPRKPRAPRTTRTAAARTTTGRTAASRAGTTASRRPASRAKRPAEPPQVPDDLVIPPKPPLPPAAEAPVAEARDATPPEPSAPEPTAPEATQTESAPVGAVAPEASEPGAPEASESDAGGSEVDAAETEAMEDEIVEAEILETEAELVETEVEGDVDEGDVETGASGARETVAEVVERDAPAADASPADAIVVRDLTKLYGGVRAVDGIDLTVPAGTFYGLVGPNGAGKTTTLSVISGLLTPDAGSLHVAGVDAMATPREAKRLIGVLPDRLRTFDRLTGRQLLYYCGVLRGLDASVVESRSADLARAFDLVEALGRPVSDYSAGMTKKIMLAGAMIHSPRVLVLDEPFEAVDPVSSAVILDILTRYVEHGGTVVLSSHGIDLVERVCTTVAVLVSGRVLAEGSVEEVRGELSLEERYVELAGGSGELEGLEWLHTFSD